MSSRKLDANRRGGGRASARDARSCPPAACSACSPRAPHR